MIVGAGEYLGAHAASTNRSMERNLCSTFECMLSRRAAVQATSSTIKMENTAHKQSGPILFTAHSYIQSISNNFNDITQFQVTEKNILSLASSWWFMRFAVAGNVIRSSCDCLNNSHLTQLAVRRRAKITKLNDYVVATQHHYCWLALFTAGMTLRGATCVQCIRVRR